MGGVLVDNEGDILHMLGAEPPSHGCGCCLYSGPFRLDQDEKVVCCVLFLDAPLRLRIHLYLQILAR